MASLTGSLLATKTQFPLIQHRSVARPRLLERLAPAQLRALTLLVAPPGFGKSTLAAEWAASLPENTVAWLTVDEDDNQAITFLSYFVASLRTLQDGVGDQAQQLLDASPAVLPRVIVTALINDIAALKRIVCLVIDDYHFVTESAVHTILGYFLDHMPTNLRLLIATRVDPPLPLSRLRARGQLSEIRVADLRFTLEETLSFLESMGLTLPEDDVARLEERTEGWIAGLQMAALSLSGHDDAFKHQFVTAFTGSHRHIVDYLADEVLERQPDDVKSFLLDTSVLNHLTPLLCDAVTGSVTSDTMLNYLDQANLFVIPLDDERQWYRYHRLFADVLRHRLHKRSPNRVPALHSRAANWYKANGFTAEAISHALAAGQIDTAAEWIEAVARDLWTRRTMSDIQSWLKLLPPGTVETRPRLLLLDAQLQLFQGHMPLVEKRVREARQRLVSTGQADHLLERELLTLEGMLENFTNGNDDALWFAQQSLDGLQPEHPLRVIALLNASIAHWLRGELDSSEQQLLTTQDAALKIGNTYHAQVAMAYHAQASLMRGRRQDAELMYREALALTPDRWDIPEINGLYVGLGALCYERDDLEAAAKYLERGIHLGEQEGNALVVIGGQLFQAFVAQAQHDTARSRQLKESALQFTAKSGIGWLWCVPSIAARASHLALLHGEGNAAQAWAETITSSIKPSPNPLQHEAEMLAAARILIAHHCADQTLPLLDEVAREAVRCGRQLHVMQAYLLRALAVKNMELSFGALEQALTVAELQGFVRLIVDEGDAMRRLLERYLNARPTSRLRAYVARLLRAFSGVEAAATVAQGLADPLSEHELEILGLMAQGLSNTEIADRLYLSVTTVKKHGTNIFGKLAARGRQDAVARAHELRLIR